MQGRALAALADEGRSVKSGLPDACATCAFREGSLANQSAGTGLLALNCALGVDAKGFACHHGMADGQPTRLCAGYVAARFASFKATKEIVERLGEELRSIEGPDDIRIAFDAWAAEIDPSDEMDVYQLGRAYARSVIHHTPPSTQEPAQ